MNVLFKRGLLVISSFPSDFLPPTYSKAQLAEWYSSLNSLNTDVGEWGLRDFTQVSPEFCSSSSFVAASARRAIISLKAYCKLRAGWQVSPGENGMQCGGKSKFWGLKSDLQDLAWQTPLPSHGLPSHCPASSNASHTLWPLSPDSSMEPEGWLLWPPVRTAQGPGSGHLKLSTWFCRQRDVGLMASSVLSQLCDIGEVTASFGLKSLLHKIGISRRVIKLPILWGWCKNYVRFCGLVIVQHLA